MLKKKHLILLLFFYSAFTASAQVTFVVKSLPKTTPKTDTIFITGSFNNWQVDDPKYMLHKQLDGTLSITIPVDSTIEYKFTRGSWMKVETNAENAYTANRIYNGRGDETVYVEIVKWLDLGGVENLNYLIFYFFAISIMGFALIFPGYGIPKISIPARQIFLMCNLTAALLFLGVVAYNLVGLIQQSYLSLAVKILLFVWGPCVYAYVLGVKKVPLPRSFHLHFSPALLVASLGILSLLNLKAFSFLASHAWFPLTYESVIILGAGIMLNAVYFIRLFDIAGISIASGLEPGDRFIKLFLIVNTATLLSLVVNLLLLCLGIFSNFLIDFELVFLTLSGIVFLQAFFVWKHAEIFRERVAQVNIEGVEQLKDKISTFMRTKKPYKNPELNIESLAHLLGIKSHVLSKVLNEGFQKNFRDFVNGYRIEEFILLATEGKLENYTYLALAYEVGFNSKSTFNLAFKKITGQNPREYFKTHYPQYTP